jgi:hypothetical protein
LRCSDSISSPRTGVEAILTELGPGNQNRRYAASSHMHEVSGLSGLNPVPSMRALHCQSYAFRGHPAQAVMTRDRFAFARAMFKVGGLSTEEGGDCLGKRQDPRGDGVFRSQVQEDDIGGEGVCSTYVDEITVHMDAPRLI